MSEKISLDSSVKPFLFFPEKSVGYFIAEQNIFLFLYLKKYSL